MWTENDAKKTRLHDPELAVFPFDGEGEGWLTMLRAAMEPGELGRLGTYELVSEVARGGQSVVYRAFDTSTKRYVALKLVRAGRLAPASVIARFQREIEATSRLEHPSIVVLYGAELLDGEPTLIMRWVDGLPFVQWAHAPHRKIRDIVRASIDVCNAVHHAHQRGIIHRDLKPSNVLVDADGRPYVLDFGLAKFETQEHSDVTRDGQFVGTVEYAAPEQLANGAALSDVRSDVYSLGLMFNKAWQSVGRGDRDLRAIAAKATQALPEDRYASVNALEADLLSWLLGQPVSARNANAFQRMVRVVRRRPAASLGVALTAAALIVLTVFLGVQTHRYKSEAERASAVQRLFEGALTPREDAVPSSSITVADALIQAAERLGRAEDVPANTLAELHQTLAKRFASFGMWNRAEEQAIKAIEFGEPLGREAWPTLAAAYRTRGTVAALHGDARAVEYSERSKNFIEQVHGQHSPEFADALTEYVYSGWKTHALSSQKVEQLFNDSLNLSQSLDGGNPNGRAMTLRTFAEFLLEQDRPDEALSAMGQAQAVLDGASDSSRKAWTLTTVEYVTLLVRLNRFDKADHVLQSALTRAQQVGDRLCESRLLWIMGELREIYGGKDNAEPSGLAFLDQSIERRLAVLAPNFVGKSRLMQWEELCRQGADQLIAPYRFAAAYAQAQYRSGLHDDAMALLDRLIELYPDGRDAPFTLMCEIEKVRMLTSMQRPNDAWSLTESLQSRIELLPAGHLLRQQFDALRKGISTFRTPSTVQSESPSTPQ